MPPIAMLIISELGKSPILVLYKVKMAIIEQYGMMMMPRVRRVY